MLCPKTCPEKNDDNMIMESKMQGCEEMPWMQNLD